MSIYGAGAGYLDSQDNLFAADENDSIRQRGFQKMIDLKNKFEFKKQMEHFKSAPKMMAIGTDVSYGISELGELTVWPSTENSKVLDRNLIIDLRTISTDSTRDMGGLIAKAGNIGNFVLNSATSVFSIGKEKAEIKKMSYNNIECSPSGDFCILTSIEGENFIFILRSRSVESLSKLKRAINSLRFIEIVNDEDKSSIKFICAAAVGLFSSVVTV